MYCKGCTANIPDRSVNCEYCGADLLEAIDPTSSAIKQDITPPLENDPSKGLASPPLKSSKSSNLLNILLICFILVPTFLYLYYWWMVPGKSEINPESRLGISSVPTKTHNTRPLAATRRGARALPEMESERQENLPEAQKPKESKITAALPAKIESESRLPVPEIKTTAIGETGRLMELFRKGIGLISEGKYQEALQPLLAAYEIEGKQEIADTLASAFFKLGMEHIKAKEFGDALDSFENSLKYKPKEAKSLYGVGLAYFHLDNYYLASINLQEAINLAPGNFDSLQLLGETYYRQNRLSEAIQLWKSAMHIQPDDKKLAAKLAKAQREEKVESGFTEGATANFVLRYDGDKYEKIGGLALQYLNMAYDKVGFDLGFYPTGEITAILYPEETFKELQSGPAWANGIFDGKIRLPVKDNEINEETFARSIFHEFTHAAIYQLTKGNIPTWLNEGLALYEEGSLRPQLEEALTKAVRDSQVFSIKELEKTFLNLPKQQAAVAYAQSHSLVKFLIESYSLTDIQDILKKLGQSKNIQQALEETIAISLTDLESEWRVFQALPASR